MTEPLDASGEAPTKVSFRTPSFARFKTIRRQVSKQSILRCLEYERLSTVRLSGRVLDFGGGGRTNYMDRMDSWSADAAATFELANIDPVTQPTFLISPEGEIPCEDGRYDKVISLNTFEHIYDVGGALDRIHRVIRPGGELLFIVPFLFRVHGHPDDYSRGTPSFWRRMLNDHGYGDVQIEALSWGPYSTGLTVAGTVGPLKRLRLQIALLLDLLYLSRRFGQDQTITDDQDASVCNAPIGYFVRCFRSV